MFLNDMKTKRYICSELCHSCTSQTTCTFVGYVEDCDWDCDSKPEPECNCRPKRDCNNDCNCDCRCCCEQESNCGCNNNNSSCCCNNDNDNCGCDENCFVCCYTTKPKPKPCKPMRQPVYKCCNTTKTCCYKKCYTGNCMNNSKYECDNSGYNCVNVCC